MQITIGFDKRQGTVIAGNDVKDVACRGDRAVFGDALKTIMKFLAAVLLADLIASAGTHRKKWPFGETRGEVLFSPQGPCSSRDGTLTISSLYSVCVGWEIFRGARRFSSLGRKSCPVIKL